jgi:hypothetical protein
MELNGIVDMKDDIFTIVRGGFTVHVRVVDVSEAKGFGVHVTVTPVAGIGSITVSPGELGKVTT